MLNLKRIKKTVIASLLILSMCATTIIAATTWNGGNSVFVPKGSDNEYTQSTWATATTDLYDITWYESPQRNVLKGEFMFVVLRTIQESLVRRNLPMLNGGGTTLTFSDVDTISTSAQEEAKVLKSLGVLSGTQQGAMALQVVVKRSEASKVLAVFNDTKGHWAETTISTAYQIGLLNGGSATSFAPDSSLTLEQTLQILENLG